MRRVVTILMALAACGQEAAPARSLDDAQSAPTSQLPAAFKGYELYAWQEAGELEFTLVVGTNRLKTLDEVRGPSVEDGDWILLRGRGLTELQRVLQRVPSDSSVALSHLEGLPALSEADRAEVERALGAK